MKCVMHVEDGYIDRVSNELAQLMVQKTPNLYTFVPKSEWKKQETIRRQPVKVSHK